MTKYFPSFSHHKKHGDEDEDPKAAKQKANNQVWWRRSIVYFMTLLVREYPYLHKMDNLCIDFKRKTVKYEQDQKRFNILRTRSGKIGKYSLDEETLKKLAEIIVKKQSQEESVSEQIESLQGQVKKLKLSLRTQHEELKKLIQECLTEKRS